MPQTAPATPPRLVFPLAVTVPETPQRWCAQRVQALAEEMCLLALLHAAEEVEDTHAL